MEIKKFRKLEIAYITRNYPLGFGFDFDLYPACGPKLKKYQINITLIWFRMWIVKYE